MIVQSRPGTAQGERGGGDPRRPPHIHTSQASQKSPPNSPFAWDTPTQKGPNGTPPARRERSRQLAAEGLSVREISERIKIPKSTIQRDLAGWEPSRKDIAKQKAARLTAEADQLLAEQKEIRGLLPGPVIDGEPTQVPGPYVPTPESEQRARKILALRRSATRLEYPL